MLFGLFLIKVKNLMLLLKDRKAWCELALKTKTNNRLQCLQMKKNKNNFIMAILVLRNSGNQRGVLHQNLSDIRDL
jgi:hypothetical protein